MYLSFLFYSAAAAVIAAAAVVIVAVAVAAAGEQNDENEDYPKAAIAVTISAEHIISLSPHLKYFRGFSPVRSEDDALFVFCPAEPAPTPSESYYVFAAKAVTYLF